MRKQPARVGGVQRDEYTIWIELRRRCIDPNRHEYPMYGARGITVCDAWLNSFDAFYNDMGPRPSKKHSIDRIDISLGYSPDNCRWATPKEQARNRRNTVRVTYRSWKDIPLVELAEKLSIPADRLRYYYRKLNDINAAVFRARRVPGQEVRLAS